MLDTVRPALTEHGIAIVQSPDMLAEHRLVTLTTRLVHTSGQWIQGTACAPAPEPNRRDQPSADGGQRDPLPLPLLDSRAMVGVAEESVDDTDGRAASAAGRRAQHSARCRPTLRAAACQTSQQERLTVCRPPTRTLPRKRVSRPVPATPRRPNATSSPTRSLGELSRLNADPAELDKSLQDTYGVQESRRADHRADARGAQRHDGAAGAGSGVIFELTLRDMLTNGVLIERESLQQALASMNDDIAACAGMLIERESRHDVAAALGDPAGVKVTERRDIRVSVRDNAALEKHLFATGKHKLVISAIRLVGATEQELYDALQMVQGVVGPTSATAARSINTGSLKSAIRKMQPAEVAALDSVRVEPVVTRSAQLVDGDAS